MTTGVSAGQVMALTNLKSRQDAICRVVKVRAYGKTQSYVEVEFTSPQPAFWGVYFPTDAPDVARMAPPEQAAAPEPAATEIPAPPAPTTPVMAIPIAPSAPIGATLAAEPIAPASPMIPPVAIQQKPAAQAETPAPAIQPAPPRPKLPESAFASIGTQEDFLPSASVNKVPRASSFVNSASAKPPASMDSDISDAIDALIAPSASALRTSPKVEAPKLEKDEPGIFASMSAAEAVAGRPGSAITPKPAAEQALPVPKQMFGVALDSASSVAANSSPGGGGKAMAFVGIAALLTVVAGGAYYFNVFHLRSFINRSGAPSAAASVVPAPVSHPAVAQNLAAAMPSADANATPQQIPGQPNAGAQPVATTAPNGAMSASSSDSNWDATEPTAAEPRIHTRQSESLAERREKTPSPADREERAVAPSQASVAIPSTFGALNSRPVVRNQNSINSAGAAPALEPDGSPAPMGSALSSIAPPAPKLAAPPKPVSAPVRVGGKLQPPRLISSALPVYPAIAQQAGVTGTVVIDTTIDTNGRVEKMRVVSGPALLRGAALDALRKWKYAPSLLNGEPVAVQLVVSIQFH